MRNLSLRSVGGCAAVGLLAATVLLLPVAEVRADAECTTAFERWSKLSTARVRLHKVEGGAQSASAAQQEGCMPSEAVRQDLLKALAKTRSTCEGSHWLDQSTKQTKELIDINASFISSVALCRTEERTSTTTPTAVETDAAVRRPAPRQRPCLTVSQINPERFVLANRKCSGSTVLAVIEKRGPSGKVDCKGYTIGNRLAVATLKDARPQINYECVLEQGGCTKAQIAPIFPECDW